MPRRRSPARTRSRRSARRSPRRSPKRSPTRRSPKRRTGRTFRSATGPVVNVTFTDNPLIRGTVIDSILNRTMTIVFDEGTYPKKHATVGTIVTINEKKWKVSTVLEHSNTIVFTPVTENIDDLATLLQTTIRVSESTPPPAASSQTTGVSESLDDDNEMEDTELVGILANQEGMADEQPGGIESPLHSPGATREFTSGSPPAHEIRGRPNSRYGTRQLSRLRSRSGSP